MCGCFNLCEWLFGVFVKCVELWLVEVLGVLVGSVFGVVELLGIMFECFFDYLCELL